MKRVIYLLNVLILFGLLLCSCQLSSQPSIANTPTLISLRDIDLSKIAITEGDLPPGYSPSQIGVKLSDISRGVPGPINWFTQKIAKGNSLGGIVDIVIYNTQSEAMAAYSVMINTMIAANPSNPSIGDESLATSQVLFMETVDVAFRRCKAAAHVQFMGTFLKDDAIAYMTRLDNRLKEIVCN